jgi:trehalose 6-phosphate synthase/phosphatase
VLVLSEFAGAAAELSEALRVNPYDVDRTADTMYRALHMPEDQRRTRMAVLRQRVMSFDVHEWAGAFIEHLVRAGTVETSVRPSTRGALREAVARVREAKRVALLLDYDGTLVPFEATPDLAVPDEELLALLDRLARRKNTTVDVVSGRKHETLERWFGALPVGLHAEHGFWYRRRGGVWEGTDVETGTWREPVLDILRDFTDRTPGALVEEKTVGLAWHYRAADPEHGAAQARELTVHLSALLSNVPVEILQGDKVVEIRPHGVNKARAVARALEGAAPGTFVFAMGDDRTDEDLFAALPDGSIAVKVGAAESRAQLRLPNVAAARALLAEIARG